MSEPSAVLKLWRRFSGLPGGPMIFTRLFCLRVPYFASIRPRFVAIRPGYCEAKVKKRRRVLNHIGTVHAIALCNLAELVAGTLCEATVPPTHRWIPKGMTVEYRGKAKTGVTAIAQWDPLPDFEGSADIPVEVNVTGAGGEVVFYAVITMWVSERKK